MKLYDIHYQMPPGGRLKYEKSVKHAVIRANHSMEAIQIANTAFGKKMQLVEMHEVDDDGKEIMEAEITITEKGVDK